MRHLDLQVLTQALEWAREGKELWFCTVLSTYGSSPRAPGAMLVATADGEYCGSLSGGCVEEEFLAAIARGDLRERAQVLRYGETQEDSQRLQLPCGGVLVVLVECRTAADAWIAHLEILQSVLLGQRRLTRRVALTTGDFRLLDHSGGDPVQLREEAVDIAVGPSLRLIIAGISPVAEACASFAKAIGCEVIVCDPRDEVRHEVYADVEMQRVLPSLFIASGACHAATAVVALTHDPRIDDLAMMEAVRTPAFYIGAMGSQATSRKRAERLRRIGQLDDAQIARIQMPIGLNLGSKTPAEIALAVMADVLRVYHGKARDEL